LELIQIATNKNTIPSDKSALVPNGLRLGSPAMTTRGLVTSDFTEIVKMIDEALMFAASLPVPGSKFKDFQSVVGDGSQYDVVRDLKQRVKELANRFPIVQ
jgi:glycine hydroxymethyltransferase